MAFFKKKATGRKSTFAPRKQQSHPVWGFLAMAVALLYIVALIDFAPEQWAHIKEPADPTSNLAGKLGVELAGWSISIGGLVAFIMPALLFWVGYLLIFKHANRVGLRLLLSTVVVVVALAGIANLLDERLQISNAVGQEAVAPVIKDASEAPEQTEFFFNGLGGAVGQLLYNQWMMHNIGTFGTTLVLVVALIVGIVFLATDNVSASVERWHDARNKRKKEREAQRSKAASLPERKKEEKKARKLTRSPLPTTAKDEEGEGPKEKVDAPPPPRTKKRGTRFIISDKADDGTLESAPPIIEPTADEEEKPLTKLTPRPSSLTIKEAEKTERAAVSMPSKRGSYTFPKLDLLAEPAEAPAEDNKEDYSARMTDLVQILGEFNVKVEPSEVQTGPVITRYEVKPLPGVRVEKIASLDKNIALGLKALAVRILAPVPGKGTVGIEVPNTKPLPVRMKEIVESKAWGDSKSEIPIVLGKDVTGKPIVEDLTKMPHMLIAGSTGSGKTVCINSVIASLLYHSGPEDLRFIMVDPKVVEMQIYNKLPHMLIPVVTEPKKVPGALKYLLKEMERRYQIFARVGVRNIAGFNSKLIKEKKEREAAEEQDKAISTAMSPEERAATANIEVPRDLDELEVPESKLPYIVCIIDELADLMMVAPQDIETGVARLAQLARAAGIHLILATQRPSVNVITGVIKANLPTRISFKVASKVDSRTILDTGGAEALIGKGDMLFVPPGTSNLVRAQGAFVSDEEINGIVDFINENNGDPEFDESIQAAVEAAGEDGEGGGTTEGEWDDEMVPKAIDVLKATKRASTSMLQRRLKIGYNRAARIMEILEDEGIVGPENGSSPREILKDLDTI